MPDKDTASRTEGSPPTDTKDFDLDQNDGKKRKRDGRGSSKQSRTNHACEPCRDRKARCDGGRPSCARCERLGSKCWYGLAKGDRKQNVVEELTQKVVYYESLLESMNPSHAESSTGTLRPKLEHPYAMSVTSDEDDNSNAGDFGTTTMTQTPPFNTPFSDTAQHSNMDISQPAAYLKPLREKDPMSSIQINTSSLPGSVQSVPQTPQTEARRSRISNACLECKKRRRKCTGGTLCDACKQAGVDCVYDRSLDRRSRVYPAQQLLESVLTALRSSHQQTLLGMIERNATIEELAAHIQSLPANLEDKTPNDQDSESRGRTETSVQSQTFDLSMMDPTLAVHSSNLESSRAGQLEMLRDIQLGSINQPDYLVLPLTIEDDSQVGRLFTKFRDAARHMIGQNYTLDDVLGVENVDVELLFRERRSKDPYSACTWACEMGRMLKNIDVFTMLASTFLLARFMRWIIEPTLENYMRLPDLMKPTMFQKLIPHRVAADLCPMPTMRDALIRGEKELKEPVGTGDGAAGMSVNWPLALNKALDVDEKTGITTVSSLFALHVSDGRNWSCGRQFLDIFPEALGL